MRALAISMRAISNRKLPWAYDGAIEMDAGNGEEASWGKNEAGNVSHDIVGVQLKLNLGEHPWTRWKKENASFCSETTIITIDIS